MAWPAHEGHFRTTFPPPPMSTSESSKKYKVSFQLLVVSLQTKPWFWTAFPAKPAAHIAPKRTKTNIWITFLGGFHANCCGNHIRKPRGPQETRPQNGKTAWPGRLTKAIFEPLFRHLRCQNVASESSKKYKVSFQLLVVSLQTKPWFWTAFPAKPAAHIAPKRTKTNIWITFLGGFHANAVETILESLVDLKKRGLKTGKQHGLAGSRRPFSNHFSATSDVKTFASESSKKYKVSFQLLVVSLQTKPMVLDRISCKASGTHRCKTNENKYLDHIFWWFPCKCCGNHIRKPPGPQETRPQNGKTAWPGRLTKAIFEPLFRHLRCQNVASESCKKYHESELWKSKAGVLVYKDRGGLKIDLATGQN